jgi:hypothetical protein
LASLYLFGLLWSIGANDPINGEYPLPKKKIEYHFKKNHVEMKLIITGMEER